MYSKYEELIKYVKQTEALSHASGLIAWDQETNMPKGSVCLLYTSPSPRDVEESRMPSSA